MSRKRPAPVLMVQGTASHVGKSTLVTALCRVFRQDGWRVAPFKAQNMALNSFVAVEGGEIGRAQAVQAEAAGVPASVHMNPILLKPEGEAQSQVVVRGRSTGSLSAGDYHRRKMDLWPIVAESLDGLCDVYDLVIAEGAGSPAEINLRDHDIANMRVALHARAPVLLVGDIERGGVFAALLGTLELLPDRERSLVLGLAINKFRGDPAILEPGLRYLEERTGLPIVGVVPYLFDLSLPEEDSLALDGLRPTASSGVIDVAIIRLPRIANFDDFEPLAAEPSLRVRYVDRPTALGSPDLVLLPGTKTTVADLTWLRSSGLAAKIARLVSLETPLVGICGGYQMLGRAIRDPLGVESASPEVPGLDLLPIETIFVSEKRTSRVRGVIVSGTGPFAGATGSSVSAYEIHMGVSHGIASDASPLLALSDRDGSPVDDRDGTVSSDGLVVGTFCHGLFGNTAVRHALVAWLHRRRGETAPAASAAPDREAQYDALAAAVRASLDVDRLKSACGLD